MIISRRMDIFWFRRNDTLLGYFNGVLFQGVMSPRSILVLSGRYHIISNASLVNNCIILTYCEVDMECYWTVNVTLTDAERMSIWISLLFNNTPCLPKHKSTIVLLYTKCMLRISRHFGPLKPLTLRVDNAKLLEVLTSLPVSHAKFSRAISLQRHVRQTMRHVVISASVERHLSRSEDDWL